MDAFTKICRLGNQHRIGSTFVKIVWDGKSLSITGVEGPTPNGNARGGCGQIDMHEWNFSEYAPGWDAEKVARFREIWHNWHMNGARPYDDAMARDGWPEIAKRQMLGYEFRLTDAALKEKKKAEESALAALRAGEVFEPSPTQFRAANRPYSVVIWVPEREPIPAAPGTAYDAGCYERARHTYGLDAGDIKRPDRKTLGWLRPAEHPDGLLTKVHPESGNGYGFKYSHPVPKEILDWLSALPDTDIMPAWI